MIIQQSAFRGFVVSNREKILDLFRLAQTEYDLDLHSTDADCHGGNEPGGEQRRECLQEVSEVIRTEQDYYSAFAK